MTTIGFANLSEQVPFAVTVRESLEAAAADYPDLSLLVRDNDLNSDKALANAREFAEHPVDLAIFFHIDERIGLSVRTILAEHKATPIIAVDIPIPMSIFFGVNNQRAGLLAGEALGRWVNEHWDGQIDRVLVMTEGRVLNVVRQRLDFGLKGLASFVNFDPKAVFHLDCGNRRDVSANNALDVLERWGDIHRIGVLCLNDDSALGVLDAARAMGRESDVVVVGQGANLIGEEFGYPDSRFIASTAYYPEGYGPHLLELAMNILNGERVPQQNFIEPTLVTNIPLRISRAS